MHSSSSMLTLCLLPLRRERHLRPRQWMFPPLLLLPELSGHRKQQVLTLDKGMLLTDSA